MLNAVAKLLLSLQLLRVQSKATSPRFKYSAKREKNHKNGTIDVHDHDDVISDIDDLVLSVCHARKDVLKN